jgi:penicillin-binding protein 2
MAMIPVARRRLVVLYAVVAALLLSLGGRLWYLQVMAVGSYASAATQDQVRTVIVPPVRGQILDDVGQPLVNNHTSLVVSVNRALVSQQPGGGIPELQRPAVLAGLPVPADPGGAAGARRGGPADHGEPG